jgi:uracil-DNA glycosylase
MDLEEIKQKMFEKLKPNGWDKILKSFIFSSEFDDILTKLWTLSESDKRFTPPLKQVFRAFEECPYHELKIVMIGQDPYPQLGVADGIAFSCGNTLTEQPSLRFLFNGVEENYPHRYERNCDLTRWSNQGILMLNTALTTEVGQIGGHYDIWKPFTAYLLDTLNNHNKGLIYVYMGKKAEDWSNLTNDNNYRFYVKHPASAAYNGSKWDCDDIFNKISVLVKENYNQTITW